jgi:hypothetical protein
MSEIELLVMDGFPNRFLHRAEVFVFVLLFGRMLVIGMLQDGGDS